MSISVEFLSEMVEQRVCEREEIQRLANEYNRQVEIHCQLQDENKDLKRMLVEVEDEGICGKGAA